MYEDRSLLKCIESIFAETIGAGGSGNSNDSGRGSSNGSSIYGHSSINHSHKASTWINEKNQQDRDDVAGDNTR